MCPSAHTLPRTEWKAVTENTNSQKHPEQVLVLPKKCVLEDSKARQLIWGHTDLSLITFVKPMLSLTEWLRQSETPLQSHVSTKPYTQADKQVTN